MLFQSTHSITECDPCDQISPRVRGHFNPRTPLQSAIISYSSRNDAFLHISIHALHYRVRSLGNTTTIARLLRFQSTHSITECDQILIKPLLIVSIFQSTHSITECDRKIWCFGPQNPHLAIKKYIKRRTNVLKKDISALFIGANPLGKTCALRVRTKSQIINGSSRARVCFAPYTSILP